MNWIILVIFRFFCLCQIQLCFHSIVLKLLVFYQLRKYFQENWVHLLSIVMLFIDYIQVYTNTYIFCRFFQQSGINTEYIHVILCTYCKYICIKSQMKRMMCLPNELNEFQFRLKLKNGCYYVETCSIGVRLLIYHSVNSWSNQFQVMLVHCVEMRKAREYCAFPTHICEANLHTYTIQYVFLILPFYSNSAI